MKHKFKAGKHAEFSNEDAQSYGEALLRLSKEKGGIIKPEDVVADAQDATKAYHDYFEWDNLKAGDEHRKWQARRLMCNIVTVELVGDNKEPTEVREFYNVTQGDNRGYVHRDQVFRNANLSDQVINRALKELELWQKRYEVYSDLQFACLEVKKVTKKMKKKVAVEAV